MCTNRKKESGINILFIRLQKNQKIKPGRLPEAKFTKHSIFKKTAGFSKSGMGWKKHLNPSS
jgi:hypothetical protein